MHRAFTTLAVVLTKNAAATRATSAVGVGVTLAEDRTPPAAVPSSPSPQSGGA